MATYCYHAIINNYVVEYNEITKDNYRGMSDWLEHNGIVHEPCDIHSGIALDIDEQGEIMMYPGDFIAVIKKKKAPYDFESETLATEVRCCSKTGWMMLQKRLSENSETFQNEAMYYNEEDKA